MKAIVLRGRQSHGRSLFREALTWRLLRKGQKANRIQENQLHLNVHQVTMTNKLIYTILQSLVLLHKNNLPSGR